MNLGKRLARIGASPIGWGSCEGASPATLQPPAKTERLRSELDGPPNLQQAMPDECAGRESSAARTNEASPDAESPLDALRRKMAAILRREPSSSPTRSEPGLPLQDFDRVETERGPVHRRLRRLGISYCVGRTAVSPAWTANGHFLALLGLDPSLATANWQRALYFDTETTGLAGTGVVAFLVGLLWFDDEGSAWLEQLLLRAPSEEEALLAHVRDRFEHSEALVSYNGKAFDVPLIAARLIMNRLSPLPPRPHLDLLPVGRRLHKGRIGSCRLPRLESEVLGFVRGEDIDGSEVPGRYAHFLRTGAEEALAAVVTHNAWDVASMAALVGLYGEPLSALPADDLVCLAQTLKRARAWDAADQAADRASRQGAGAVGARVRGEIAKARGDKAAALAHFECADLELDDPRVRLELTKLYEHHVKEPLRALEVARKGTGESSEATARRLRRLERKATRRTQP